MSRVSPIKEPLFQVIVQCEGKPLAVGPKIRKAIAEELCGNLNKQIIDGKLKGWHDPQVIPCSAPQDIRSALRQHQIH